MKERPETCNLNTTLSLFMMRAEGEPFLWTVTVGHRVFQVSNVLHHLVCSAFIQGEEYSCHFAGEELEAVGIQVSEQRSNHE